MSDVWDLSALLDGGLTNDVSVTDDGDAVVETPITDEDVEGDSLDIEVSSLGKRYQNATDDVVMLTEDLRRVDAIKEYLKLEGFTKDLVLLHNYDNFMTFWGFNVPALESIDCRHGPYSKQSIIAMEEADGVFASIWAWIKKMCRKIHDFFQEFFTKFLNLFSNYKKKIKRLEKLLEKRHDKPSDDVAGVEINAWVRNEAEQRVSKIKEIIKGIINIGGLDSLDESGSADEKTIENKVSNATDKDEYTKQYEEAENSLNDIDYELENHEVVNARANANALIMLAYDVFTIAKEYKRINENMETATKKIYTAISNIDKDTEIDDEARKARSEQLRDVTQLLSKRGHAFISAAGALKRVLKNLLKSASGFIARGTVSRS